VIDRCFGDFEKKTKRGAEKRVESVFIGVGEGGDKGEAIGDLGENQLPNQESERRKRRKVWFER
jgi:hypothetical protein